MKLTPNHIPGQKVGGFINKYKTSAIIIEKIFASISLIGLIIWFLGQPFSIIILCIGIIPLIILYYIITFKPLEVDDSLAEKMDVVANVTFLWKFSHLAICVSLLVFLSIFLNLDKGRGIFIVSLISMFVVLIWSIYVSQKYEIKTFNSAYFARVVAILALFVYFAIQNRILSF